MRVRREWRRRGIGRQLMETYLRQASEAGLENVELEVYPDNQFAVLLYKQFGFVEEGLRRRARKLDGRYQDIELMALWLRRGASAVSRGVRVTGSPRILDERWSGVVSQMTCRSRRRRAVCS
jgi:predicted N-acetyltransferase YhbS